MGISPGGAVANSQACKRLGSTASRQFVAFSPGGGSTVAPPGLG
jgi:hypothetical protein